MNEFIFRTLLSFKPKGMGRVCGNLNLAFLQKKTSNLSLKILMYVLKQLKCYQIVTSEHEANRYYVRVLWLSAF